MTAQGRVLNSVERFSASWWVVVVVGILVSAVIFQRWQMLHPTRPEVLKVGDRLPTVEMEDIRGRSASLDWRSNVSSTIVYVFTPTCIWCKRNMDAMKTLLQGAGRNGFVGVSLTASGLTDYLSKNDLTLPVYVASSSSAKQLKLSGTPETIFVSTSGVVKGVWFGAYGGRSAEQIEQTFGVKLPPLRKD